MKKVFAICLCALMFSSCGLLGVNNAGTAPSAANSVGQTIGQTIKSLFTQYQSNGTLNLKDGSTLLNLANLAANYQNIKAQLKNSSFYSDFLAGLFSGSNNQVNNNNAGSVLSLLNNLDLGALAGLVGTKASEVSVDAKTAAQTASTMNQIFNVLGK